MKRRCAWIFLIGTGILASACSSSTEPEGGIDPEKVIGGEWKAVASLLSPVRAPMVATDGARLYVFGGSAGASPRTAHTQIFDPATGSWTLGVNIPKAVEWGSAVYANGFIHLLGGVTDEAAATDEHWIYDPTTGEWSAGPSLPFPSAGSAAALVSGRIVLAGGIDGPSAYADHVQIFDPVSDRWTLGAPVPARIINWQAAAIGDVFYAAGGLMPSRITSSALYRYDLASDSWTSIQPMPARNEGYAGTEFLGLYCVLGGRLGPAAGSFNDPFDRFDCFNPETQAWHSGTNLPTAAEEMGAVSLNGALYAIGGRVSYGGVIGEVYRLGH
jgi:serine/threonine-protein kinase PknK